MSHILNDLPFNFRMLRTEFFGEPVSRFTYYFHLFNKTKENYGIRFGLFGRITLATVNQGIDGRQDMY